MDNPHYKSVSERAANLKSIIDVKQEQIQRHTDELTHLYSFRREWEDNVTVGFTIRPNTTALIMFFIECCCPSYSGTQSHACQARFGKCSIKGAA